MEWSHVNAATVKEHTVKVKVQVMEVVQVVKEHTVKVKVQEVQHMCIAIDSLNTGCQKCGTQQ